MNGPALPYLEGHWWLLVDTPINLPYTSTPLHLYSPLTQSWLPAGVMPVGVHKIFTVTLPNGEMMVIGGQTRAQPYSQHLYKAHDQNLYHNAYCSNNHCHLSMINTRFDLISVVLITIYYHSFINSYASYCGQ